MQWATGADGLVPEASLLPVTELPSLADVQAKIGARDPTLLNETVHAREGAMEWEKGGFEPQALLV
jgi:hypothetical protein